MNSYKAVIHLHSKYSFDCFTNPARIIDRAVQQNIDLICITDHDTIEGSVAAKKYAAQKFGTKINVMIGAEYNSTHGDIIGLDINTQVSGKDPAAIIHSIKEQNGLVLLPHPYYHHKDIEWLAEQSDMIEIFNSRISEEMNEKAIVLAEKLNKPVYVASDAHFLSDIFLCINKFNIDEKKLIDAQDILLNSTREFISSYSAKSNVHRSQIVKGLKQRSLALIFEATRQYASARLRPEK